MSRKGFIPAALIILATACLLGGCGAAGAPATSPPPADTSTPPAPTSPSAPTALTPALPGIVIRQSGGMPALLAECQDRDYVTAYAAYIIEGDVTMVESRPGADGGVYTYSDIAISRYVKGTSLGETMQIITPGGASGGVTMWVEDQPFLHQGTTVRLYLYEHEGQFGIFCGPFGIEVIG